MPATLPNLLSACRIALAPVLLALAWRGLPEAFLAVLALALLTDLLDGWLARRLGQVSDRGAELDSLGDLCVYLAVPVAAWWLWPEALLRDPVSVTVIVASYTFTSALGFLRYGRVKSFSTWSGRVSAFVLSAGAVLLLLDVSVWPLRVAALVVVLSDLEEIAMMALLPRWRANVPSLWHAARGAPRRA